MAGVQDIMSLLQMFAGGGAPPMQQPAMPAGPMSPSFVPPQEAPMPTRRPVEFGGTPEPSPEAADPFSIPTGATVLARLRGKKPGGDDSIFSSLGSAIPGALKAKTNGSKWGAFAQGFAGGMGSQNEALQKERAAEAAAEKSARDETYRRDVLGATNSRADASLASQERRHAETLEEAKRNHDLVDRRNSITSIEDPVTRAITISKAESDARKGFGLTEANLSKAERTDRQRQFDTWRSKQPWAKDEPSTAQPGRVPPASAAGTAPTQVAPVPAATAAPGAVAPAKIGSKAEFDKLPSGATFIAPDGSVRRKP